MSSCRDLKISRDIQGSDSRSLKVLSCNFNPSDDNLGFLATQSLYPCVIKCIVIVILKRERERDREREGRGGGKIF